MTVPTTKNKVTYAGNGSTRSFSFNFPVLDESHIHIVITDQSGVETELTDGYTLSLNSQTVVYPRKASDPALAEGYKITILRELPLTQEVNLINQGNYDAETLEREYDRLCMQIQQVSEKADRAVKTSMSSSDNPDELMQTFYAGVKNAEASAEQASTSADNAAASASTAAEQADNATASATSAAASAASATAAANSATQAAASASTAAARHDHAVASKTSNGYMSNTDKIKLDGISAGAEVNQKAFAAIKALNTVLNATSKSDTLTMSVDQGLTISGDADNRKIIIGVQPNATLPVNISGKAATAAEADKAIDAATLNGQKSAYYRCSNNCSWTCSSGCSGGCGNGCSGSCLASCSGGCSSCTNTCKGSCTSCSGSCIGNCTNTCTGSCTSCSGCTGSCVNGCTGCSQTCSGSCGSDCGYGNNNESDNN